MRGRIVRHRVGAYRVDSARTWVRAGRRSATACDSTVVPGVTFTDSDCTVCGAMMVINCTLYRYIVSVNLGPPTRAVFDRV